MDATQKILFWTGFSTGVGVGFVIAIVFAVYAFSKRKK